MKFIDSKDWKAVSEIKRVMEYETMIPGFYEEMEKDAEATFKKYNINLKPEDVQFDNSTKTDENSRGYKMTAIYPDSKAPAYADFMNKKFMQVDEIKTASTPTNPAMKKWRERQMNRCIMQLGGKMIHMVHAPFALELSSGCSIGCEFCGFNAGKLKSVFRYTEENSKLFNEVIYAAKEIIGDAAGQGTMYYATEPLDNPDYELFMNDYLKCFGTLPQITTAASARHIELLHRLLKQLNEKNDKIYRFSITSAEIRDIIFKEFAPEELPLVELLPQFSEAPGNNFINAGRNVKNDEEYGDTIACMSGFIVNMVEKSVKISTPTSASKEHPTGEIIIDKGYFTSGEDFRELLLSMISKHMNNILGPKEKLILRKDLCYSLSDDGILNLTTNKGAEFNLKCNEFGQTYVKMLDFVAEAPRTRREIVKYLLTLSELGGGTTDVLHFTINRLWHLGVFEAQSGLV